MPKISLTGKLKNADHYTSNLVKVYTKTVVFLRNTPVHVHNLVYMAAEFMKN